jgi:hypothetical protein
MEIVNSLASRKRSGYCQEEGPRTLRVNLNRHHNKAISKPFDDSSTWNETEGEF